MLRLSLAQYQQMRRHAAQCYPAECCGILAGKLADGVRAVTEVIECENAAPRGAGHDSYAIPPEQLIAAQKRVREQHCDIIGFYHSHPDNAARWSQRDLDGAHWFASSYVITSIENGVASRTQSYVLCGTNEQDKRFDDEEIEIR